METFLKFLSKYYALLLFVLLEAVSALIIFNGSVFQKSFFSRLSTETASFFYSKTNNIFDYFHLRDVNESLSEQNTFLQQKIKHLESLIEQDSISSNVPSDTLLRFIPAKIVSKSVDKINNYLIIDKGKKDGISEEMGVISSNGVVGVVQNVSDNFAVVISVLSTKLKISGKLQNSNYLCSVIWNGFSPFSGMVYNIPEHIKAKIDDKIVTSGYSSIFPENMEIGTIKKITLNATTAWNDYKIQYSTNFMTVSYVSVVAFSQKDELSQIKKTISEQ